MKTKKQLAKEIQELCQTKRTKFEVTMTIEVKDGVGISVLGNLIDKAIEDIAGGDVISVLNCDISQKTFPNGLTLTEDKTGVPTINAKKS